MSENELDKNPLYVYRREAVRIAIVGMTEEAITPILSVYFLPGDKIPHERAAAVLRFESGWPSPFEVGKRIKELTDSGPEKIGEIMLIYPFWLTCNIPQHASGGCDCPEGSSLVTFEIRAGEYYSYYYSQEIIEYGPDVYERRIHAERGPFPIPNLTFAAAGPISRLPDYFRIMAEFLEPVKW